jgi:hypothetical protein
MLLGGDEEKTYLQNMSDVISLSVQSNSKDWDCPCSPRQSFTTCVRSIRNQLGRTNGADELLSVDESTEQRTPIWEGLGWAPESRDLGVRSRYRYSKIMNT